MTEPSCVLASSIASTNPKCNASADGTINLTVSGNVGTPTYLWSNGATTKNLTALAAATYSVTVTDGACSTIASVTLSEPTILTINCTKTNVTLNSGNDGTASVSASGATAPYTYLWSNGATTATISALTANTYSVTVTDANGCSKICSSVVTEPACVLTSSLASTNPKCNGSADGTITLTVNGNVGTPTYLWSNGATTKDLTTLSAATYSVTVTDGACSTIATVTLSEPTILTINCTKTNVTLNSGNDGTASVSASGATAPYTYLWSNGATTATISALTANTYSVTVTDANGCSKICSSVVTEPSCNLSANEIITQPTCSNNDGVINLTIFGANGTTTFNWSNGAITKDLSGLSAGTYTVTITNNGCIKVLNYELAVVSTNTKYNFCPGDSLSLEIVIVGLTNIQWQRNGVNIAGATGATYIAKSVGIYTYTSNNVSGCVIGQCCPVELVASSNCCKPVICTSVKLTRN